MIGFYNIFVFARLWYKKIDYILCCSGFLFLGDYNDSRPAVVTKVRYTLATKSTVVETGDKSATRSTLLRIGSTLSTFRKVDHVEFDFVASVHRA